MCIGPIIFIIGVLVIIIGFLPEKFESIGSKKSIEPIEDLSQTLDKKEVKRTGTYYCEFCGAKLPGVAIFCAECGKKQSTKRSDKVGIKSLKELKGNYTKVEAVTKSDNLEGFHPIESVKAEFKVGDELLKKYKIIDIKKGGMGLVYISVDKKTNNLVAIKTFQKQFLQNDRVVDAFLREAETWVNLGKHTNLVWAQGVARIDGKPYIFIEYVDGGNLDDRIIKGNISIENAVDYGIQICTGMGFAHKKLGTVHRDIKPSNIMLTSDDTIKITDFGLVKTAEYLGKSEFLTSMYASPEQIQESLSRGGKSRLDTRSDIYSFGLVMYGLLTGGEMPFKAKTRDEWIKSHLQKPPIDIKKYNADLPDELREIVMKSLNKNPQERWSSFSTVQQRLINIYNNITSTKYQVKGKEEKIDERAKHGSRIALGLSAQLYGKYGAAMQYYEGALKGYMEKGDKRGQSTCYINMGVNAKLSGNYKQALEYYNKALQIDIALGDKQGQCKCYGDMGNVAAAINNFDQALKYYSQSLEIALALGDKQVQSMLYTNLGAVSKSRGNLNQALDYFNKSVQITMALGDIQGQAVCYNNMGIIARKIGDFNKALEHYNNSLRTALTLGDKQLQSACYRNMGNVAADMGDFRRALEYFQKALELNRRIGVDTSELEKYIWEVKRMM